MTFKLIDFEKIHAYEILEKNVRDIDLRIGTDWENAINGWYSHGPAYTLIVDGEIVGCGGIVCFGNNVAEAWMLMTNLFYKYKYTVFKATKKTLEDLIEEYRLKRVQSLIQVDFEGARNFIEHLGFQFESILRSFGPKNQDFMMFTRIE